MPAAARPVSAVGGQEQVGEGCELPPANTRSATAACRAGSTNNPSVPAVAPSTASRGVTRRLQEGVVDIDEPPVKDGILSYSRLRL